MNHAIEQLPSERDTLKIHVWDSFKYFELSFIIFSFASEVVYHGSASNYTIDQWRFQVFDKYDWDIDEKTQDHEKVKRYVFIFLTEDVIDKYNFTSDYSAYVEHCVPLPGYENIMLLNLDVIFFIEMEISLKPEINNPHWYDVFSEIVDAKDWIIDFQ